MNCSTKISLRGESGGILVVTLMIVFAVAVMGAALSMMSSTDLKISGNQRFSARAFNSAEAGLSEAIHRLTLADPTMATIGGWTGNIAIGDSEPYDPNWEARIYLTSPATAPVVKGVFTTGTIQDPNDDYMAYSSGSGTNDVLTIVHKWDDVDNDNVRDPGEVVLYDPGMVPPENLATGFPVEIVTVTARHAGANRTLEAEVTRRTVLGRTLAALYSDHAVEITGNPGICGHNHDVNTPDGTKPNGCFAWHLGGGHLPGVTTTGDDVDVGGTADVIGDPAPTDTSSSNSFYSVAEVLGLSDQELKQLLASADFTAPANPMHGISYVQGDAHINSNWEGSGLMYVTGDMIVNGDFSYKGLIYIEGDLKITGAPWLLGSTIVRGKADYTFSAGNAAILYSGEALKSYVGRYMPAILLSWREL
jgi:hypothetical protein